MPGLDEVPKPLGAVRLDFVVVGGHDVQITSCETRPLPRLEFARAVRKGLNGSHFAPSFSQTMTGHRAPATTEHYTHRKLERLRRAQELVEAFEREERIAAAAQVVDEAILSEGIYWGGGTHRG